MHLNIYKVFGTNVCHFNWKKTYRARQIIDDENCHVHYLFLFDAVVVLFSCRFVCILNFFIWQFGRIETRIRISRMRRGHASIAAENQIVFFLLFRSEIWMFATSSNSPNWQMCDGWESRVNDQIQIQQNVKSIYNTCHLVLYIQIRSAFVSR